jgi:7-cyano-7-deazaguanine synthase
MTTPPGGALVLLSGGLDSTTALATTHATHTNVQALFINYGQRHIRERQSSQAVANHYNTPWTELDLRAYGASVTSALTTPGLGVPHGHYTAETMAATVVPNRNATMLSAAAGIAASRGLATVVTAVHAGDHAIYPDCRPEFITALSTATELGCGVTITAPFVHTTKTDIAREGAALNTPYDLTWSCYEGGDTHCGRCGTCVERAEAFHDAGVTDPTTYTDPQFWKQAVKEAATR